MILREGIRGAFVAIFAIALLFPAIAKAIDYSLPIKDVRIKGVNRADNNTVRFYIHSRKDRTYDPDKTREDIKRLFKLGFFDNIQLDINEEQDGLILTYLFTEKPFVRNIILTGLKEIKEKEIILRVKTRKGTFFRQDHIPWDEKRIKQVYRNKGFYFTEARTIVRKLPDNQVDVEFIVDGGQKIGIEKVLFRGVKAFPTQELNDVIETSAGGWASFLTDKGAYKKDALKTDLLRIESYYHDQGYIKARILDPEVEIDREQRNIYVTFPVVEGPQYFVSKINIHGDEVYSEEELTEALSLAANDIFNRSKFRKDIFGITDLYSQKGYAYANVIPKINVNENNKTVSIDMSVQKGRKVYIGQIRITGNQKTRDRVIRRQFRLDEGEQFNSAKLRRSKERINRLAFYESVDIEQRSRAEEDLIDIETKVVERNTGQISGSVGYGTNENLLLQAQVKWQNLLGRGQELSVNLDNSSRRNDYSFSFKEPAIFDRDISGSISLYNKNYDYDTYKSNNLGGSLSAGKALSEYLWARVGYKYETTDVEINDFDKASVYLKAQEGQLVVGSINPSLTYDTRNDPFSPTAGYKLYGFTEFAGVGGEARFYRLIGEYTVYKSLWGDFAGMFHTKIGRAEGYDGKGLPITERFFLGGAHSLRGFKFNEVGPLDQNGEAIGGEASLLINVELQYRFTRYFRGFLLYDRGNVYGSNDAKGNTTSDFYNLEDMRHSWGFGLHFLSPMGPITLAYGIKLDQRTGESANEFHFTIGGAF